MMNHDNSSGSSSSNITSAAATSSSLSHMVQIFQTNFDPLLRLQSFLAGSQVTHASSLVIDAYTASSRYPWLIDSGAFHTIGIKDKFNLLEFLDKYRPIHIADSSSFYGQGTSFCYLCTNPSQCIFYSKISYQFFLFISLLTKSNNYSLTFFIYYCVFQDFQTDMIIGMGCEKFKAYIIWRKRLLLQDFLRSLMIFFFSGTVVLVTLSFRVYVWYYLQPPFPKQSVTLVNLESITVLPILVVSLTIVLFDGDQI